MSQSLQKFKKGFFCSRCSDYATRSKSRFRIAVGARFFSFEKSRPAPVPPVHLFRGERGLVDIVQKNTAKNCSKFSIILRHIWPISFVINRINMI
jgi:hypothetical protein